jgi:hypothetical protein
MLRAAKLGALPAVNADLSRNERDVVFAAGDEVLLAGEAGYPEAVDHVVGMKCDPDGYADGQMKLVRRMKRLRDVGGIILNVPPPLVRGDGDREALVRRRARQRAVGDKARDGESNEAHAHERTPGNQARPHQGILSMMHPVFDDVRIGTSATENSGDQERDDERVHDRADDEEDDEQGIELPNFIGGAAENALIGLQRADHCWAVSALFAA